MQPRYGENMRHPRALEVINNIRRNLPFFSQDERLEDLAGIIRLTFLYETSER